MSEDVLYDVYSCAGGAGMGYKRAGFRRVIGIDNRPQPNYPFEFHQADALKVLKALAADREPWPGAPRPTAIHASPPCQAFTAMGTMPNAREHPDLLTPTRALLERIGLPYVIENVPGSPIDVRPPDLFGYDGAIMLCGSMFELRTDEYELRRHRWFEASIPLIQPPCRHSHRRVVGFYGDHARIRARVNGSRDRGSDILGEQKMALVKALMRIDWMSWTEANQAIPPAYTAFLGAALLEHLSSEAAA